MESTNRIKATITMNPEISQRIRTLSTTTMIPMSRLVERAILEYLARQEEQRQQIETQQEWDRIQRSMAES